MNSRITRAVLGLFLIPLVASPATSLLRLEPTQEGPATGRQIQEPTKEAEWPAWSQPTQTIEQAAVSGRIKRRAYEAFRKRKQVPVILMLKTLKRFRPEGQLSANQVEKQREEINQLQQKVLGQISQKFKNKGVRFIKRYYTIPYLAMHLDRQVLPALVKMPEIARIYLDGNPKLTLDASIPLIGADKVHSAFGTLPTDANAAGAGQAVAVIDTGVDGNRRSLLGRIIAEACFSTGDSVCPGGNDAETGTGAGAPCTFVECYHGTHVAGIIAGNDSFFRGVAPQANIIAINVAHRGTCARARSGDFHCVKIDDCDLLRALEHVFLLRNNHQIAAVNLSLGDGEFYTSHAECDDDYACFRDLVANLRSVGIVTITGAGNDAVTRDAPHVLTEVGLQGPFACLSNVISVGATRDDDMVARFSQTASFLQLLAPGHEITSSIPGGGYRSHSGTSQAAPHVAGAWAVLMAIDPWRTPDNILSILRSTGVPISDNRFGPPIVVPRIQLDKAVESQTGAPLPPGNLRVVQADGTSITVGWTDNSDSESQFEVLATPPPNAPIAIGSTRVGANSTEGQVTLLTCSTIYEIHVRACNGAGRCSDSRPITAETRNTLPASPTNFRAGNVTTNSIEISWDWAGGAIPVARFRLRSNANFLGEWRTDSRVPSGTRSRLFSNLPSGGYSFIIQACNADGCCTDSESLHVVTQSLGPPPSAPTNLRLCTRTVLPEEICWANGLTFYWYDTSVRTAHHFKFEWRAAQRRQDFDSVSWSSNDVPGGRNSYFMSPLSPGLYYFRVSACNVNNVCSRPSNEITYTAR